MNTQFSLAELLPNLPQIVIVHVGASILPGQPEPYVPLVAAGHARVVCFEPNQAECAKLRETMGTGYTILPHFIGAGGLATFHETNTPFTGSLLEPDPAVLNSFHFLGEFTVLKAKHTVTTTQLDDIPGVAEADYLKIDIQGAEFDAFGGAAKMLAACILVETEVEFVPLYKDQPLFAHIDSDLRARGFSFHTFKNTCGRYFKPMAPQGSPHLTVNQLLWSDAIYVRDMLRLDRYEITRLLKLAVLLHDLYRSIDLAYAALLEVDRRGSTRLAETYFSRLTAAQAAAAVQG